MSKVVEASSPPISAPVSWSAIEPDVMTPVQFSGRQKGSLDSPEMRLKLAILEEAFNCLHHGRGGVLEKRLRAAEVRGWIDDEDWESPYSFLSICYELNLDPDYLRRGAKLVQERGLCFTLES